MPTFSPSRALAVTAYLPISLSTSLPERSHTGSERRVGRVRLSRGRT